MTCGCPDVELLGPDWRHVVAMQTPDRLLTPGEVALIFGVDPKTVAR